MSDEETMPRVHQDVVRRLIADARPLRPLAPPLCRTVPWIILELATVLLAAAVGLRRDVIESLASRRLTYELAGLLAAGAGLGWLALRAAVPGEEPSRRLRQAALLLGGGLVGSLGVGPVADDAGDGLTLAVLLRCWTATAGFAAIPWLMLRSAQRRGVVLDGFAAAGLVGAAAFLLAGAAVRITCPIDAHDHLLVSHSLPVVVGTALAMRAGPKRSEGA